MLKFHKTVASVFGIGSIPKGSGTVAALFVCLVLILVQYIFKVDFKDYQTILLISSALVTFLGRYSSKIVEPIWGEDSSKIVIDEVAGMLITLCFVPFSLINIALGFVLFRFFDIYKPLYIRHFEKYKNGWGVMLDDVAAGVWANIALQLIVYLNF
jgi:phosphatidylglycerophosphatase A